MARTPLMLLLFLLLVGIQHSFACIDGTQPECMCETAPVLCTIDDLDGFVFGMSSYQHPQDGPRPLCSNAPNSVPNNPTWFAFTAWCNQLTLRASFSGCNPRFGSIGVQIAIYGDCNFGNQVACAVDPGSCNTNDKTLVMNNLVIGQTYYFLVDGCQGSDCTVTIDVVGTCGRAEIAPWTQSVTGATQVCVGDSETYSVEFLQGATTYHWYIDGTEVAQTSGTSYNVTWNTPGTYQLCVDASSDPCVPVTDPPSQNCITVTVSDANAGVITATPSPLCPGETSTVSASGYSSGPNNRQLILITDASGTITQIISGDQASVSSNQCETISVCSFNYVSPGTSPPRVGQNVNSIDCINNCCDVVCTDVQFEDSEAPTFPNAPADVTLTCFNDVPAIGSLEWNDNCDGTGNVAGTETGSANLCNGGSISRTWEYTDGCNNPGIHTQTITVDPTPPPTFTNPPADITVTCGSVPSSAPDLNYTNNVTGACAIAGSVPATQSGTGDQCGGQITYTWTFTDPCNNTITHSQNITIDPAPAPSFTNLPADMTVSCDNVPVTAPDLNYTNNATGNCLIAGSVPAVRAGTGNQCGGQISFSWTFTDQCNNTISHTQNITIDPPAVAAFVNPPADQTVSCDNVPATAPPLSYTNNGTGNCLVAGSVPAVRSGSGDQCGGQVSFTWTFTDPCNNTITHVQNITIDPAPAPVFLNPPPDLQVSCDNIPLSAPPLSYTNNASGLCLVAGSVAPTQSGGGDICGGQIINTWTFTDPCNNTITHVQTITIDPAPIPAFTNLPPDQTVSCVNAPTGAPPPLSYTNNAAGSCLIAGSVPATVSGPTGACNDQVVYTWSFTDQCDNLISHTQTITILPPDPAAFTNLPADQTVECNSVPLQAPALSYTNNSSGNCLIAGSVPAARSGFTDYCGGQISYNWTFVDLCGRTIQHRQNITVNPAPQAAFTNLPGPITLECASVPLSPPTLSYTNGETGSCAINGTVVAIQSGSYDACGGSLSYTWVFTDDCNRTISHTQEVTVNPANSPAFTNFPPDLTISCNDPLPPALELTYTNGETGNCAIAGSVPAVEVVNGTGIIYTWTFVDPCTGQVLTHTQNISRPTPPEIFATPAQISICQGESIDLSVFQVTDVNNTGSIFLTYHFALPANASNQYPSSVVSPFNSTIYYILATNQLGCTATTAVEVVVEEPVFAGFDGSGVICFEDASDVNLFDYILGNPNPLGMWGDPDLTGVDLFNAFNVDLSGLSAGTYTFSYTITGSGVCPPATSFATLTLLPPINLSIISIECSSDPQFYQVLISGPSGLTYTNNVGTLTDLGNDEIRITDIPIDQSLTVSAGDPNNPGCSNSLTISPPDCDCPNVDPPVSDGDPTICEGDPIPELSVTVGSNETANWYDAPAGGTLLQGGSLTYQPTASAVGVYQFYVETEDRSNGCISSIRTLVELEIVANPVGQNAELSLCDDGDGFVAFDLTAAEAQISSENGIGFSYFESLTDAQNNLNPLSNPYTNTSTPNQTLYVRLTNPDNCFDIVELELEVLPLPSIDLQLTPESCLGAADGSVTVTSTGGVRYSVDSTNWSNNATFGPLAADDYTMYVESADGCVAQQDFNIAPGLDIQITDLTFVCNDNGTPSDPSDDFYTLSFAIDNSLGVNGTYTLNDGNADLGSFAYGSAQSLDIPAQGQTLTLTFTDDDRGCTASQVIGPLVSCSDDCLISLDLLDFVCDDNGTDTDPSDDFYTISVQATAVNGSTNNTYNVLINGTVQANFPYGTTSTFTLPADGSSVLVAVVDNEDPDCRQESRIGPLTGCSDACLINLEAVNFSCNNNGTITDPSDDFYQVNLNASAINPGANNSFEVFADGISQGVFDYSNTATFTLPADGATVLIRIQDADDANCATDQQIGPLDPCDQDCSISATVSNVLCNDNGTPTDPSDDTFTFDLLVDGQNTGASWQSTNSALSGAYGTALSFGPYNISDGNLNIELQDVVTPSCLAAIFVQAPTPCSDLCVMDFASLDFTCNDNGTPTDVSDDFYELQLTANAVNAGTANTFELFVDNASEGIFGYTDNVQLTLPANGQSPSIRIVDTDKTDCEAVRTIGPLDPCGQTCSINAALSNVSCDDNGTPTDPSDDTFTFELLVNGQNTGAGWQATNGGINGDYGIVQSYGPYPISGGGLSFELVDLTTASCLTTVDVVPPATCSDQCDIQFDLLDFTCNDNNTITDPGDDFYEVSLRASAINPGAANTFEVFANAVSQGVFNYTDAANFNLPADGSVVTIRIVDSDKTSCELQQDIGPLDPCDQDCNINATVSNVICDDNGTPTDPSDDTFTFDLLVNGQNTGAGWEATNGAISGPYGLVQTYGPYPISGGALSFELADLTTATCLAMVDVTPPATCSDQCDIQFDLLDFTCNDNGTITNPGDDFYEVSLRASAINPGAANTFEVFANAVSQGVFNYTDAATFNLPADGSVVTIRIVDSDKTSCEAQQDIGPLDPCDQDCNINATVSNIICDDNGTPTDPSDDTFTFDLLVNGQNTGVGWEATNGTINGTYGVVQSFGPYPISGGTLSFELADLTTATCLAMVDVTPPATCSDQCDIQFDLLDFTCNDNGTITNPGDDFYEVSLRASAINPGAANTFEVFANAVSQGVFNYTDAANFNLPADGSVVSIRIVDSDKTSCDAQQDIGPLDPCDQNCNINATVSNIICDDNGTPTDPSDDTFTFDLLVNGQNTGAGWEATNGSINGNYGVVQNYGPYPISGGALRFELADLTTATCITTVDVTPPATCSDQCDIQFDLLDFTCNDNSTITDPGDDFYEVSLRASAINPGAANTFEVFANAVSQGVFNYTDAANFNLPADGSVVTIRIVDSDKTSCDAQQDIGPLDPCDQDCNINATVSNIQCDDNGTGNDASDDTFTFDLLVNGQNTGAGWQATNGTISGTYGVVQSYGPYPISGGTLNFDLQDLTTSACQTTIEVIPPMPCSSCTQTIDAGPSALLTCEDGQALLIANSSDVGDYLWTGPNSFSQTGASVSVVDSGWYFVTATYPDACMAMDSVYVAANQDSPTAAAGPDLFLTCDRDSVLLDASQSSTGPDIVYEWTDESGNLIGQQSTVWVKDVGTYRLQLTDTLNGCVSPIDEMVVSDSTGIPTAFIYADPDNVLDCQVSSVLLYSDNQSNVVYFWNSVEADEVVVSEPGTITLMVVDTITGCSNTDEIVITDLTDYPFVDVAVPDTLSCYLPSILIDASSSQSGPTLVYDWFDPSGQRINGQNGDSLRVDQPGSYVLQVRDTVNGCENFDTIEVATYLDDLPQAVIGQVGALNCYQSSQVLDASSSTPFGQLEFEWTSQDGNILSGANGPVPEIDAPGLYSLRIIDPRSGCRDSSTIEIIQDTDEPQLSLQAAAVINCYDPQQRLEANAIIATDSFRIEWTSNPPGGIVSDGDSLRPLIQGGGTYTIRLINLENGCESIETIQVSEDTEAPLAVATVEDGLDCLTDQVALNGDGSSVGSIYSYSWTGPSILSGSNGLTPIVNAAGTYQLRVLNSDNGCEETDEVTVQENDNVPQALDVLIGDPLCFGDRGSMEILTVDGGEPPYLYSIDGGSSYFDQTQFPSLEAGSYALRVQDANGCEYEEVFVIPEPPLINISLQPEITIELGESDRLRANVNIPDSQIDSISWTPADELSCTNCLDPLITPLNGRQYTIQLIDINGCPAEAKINVRVNKERNIYIPNAFSPNGDGVNEGFTVFGPEDLIKQINSFQVFDRWGELIYENYNFQPNNPANGWDGRLRGEVMNPAVFVYWAEVEFIDGVTKLYKGDVTLLK